MSFTATELMQIGELNSDGIAGFEAQVSLAKTSIEAVWPEHFIGSRVDNFRKGSAIARTWMMQRRAMGNARRKIRLAQRRDNGLMTVLRPTPAERHQEQLDDLRVIVARYKLVHS